MPTAEGWRVQFVALAAIWGSSFLFIKVLDERHWAPTWVAFDRVALGAATLVVLVYARGERLRVPRAGWPHLLIAALFLNAIPFTLFAYGEHHVSSVVAGLWNASAPLWVLVFVLLVFGEKPTAARAAGLAFGFVGVVLLLGPWRGLGGGEAVGHLACAGAAVCYGVGFPYARRYVATRPESGVVLAAAQLLCATALLAVFVPFTAAPTLHIGAGGVLGILSLGVLGTGVAYVLNYAILRAAGATTAATVTYVVPVFSTALGAVVLGETIHWNQPLGAAVLLTGIAISQGRLKRLRTRSPARVTARSR